MHYLRFEMPTTLVEWDRADLNYESKHGIWTKQVSDVELVLIIKLLIL